MFKRENFGENPYRTHWRNATQRKIESRTPNGGGRVLYMYPTQIF